MAKKEIIKIRNILSALLEEKGIHVDKIVIFGSYAKGKKRKDSDIDIIVVSRNFRNRGIFERVNLTKDIHWELVERILKPFDLMYYSDEDWKKGNSLIINAAKREGTVIYC